MADRQEEFARDEILPSWFVNRVQDRIAGLSRFRLTLQSPTTIACAAAPTEEMAVLNVGRNWRFVEAPITRAHPGGAAGTYLIFATAKAQSIVNVPAANTDTTDYSFGLAIVANGSTPAIVAGTVDAFRRIGRLTWDGAAITSLVQEVGAVGGAMLDDDVFVAGGVTATRQPGGGFLLSLAHGAAVRDRQFSMPVVEQFVSATTAATANTLASVALVCPYAGAIYDVDFVTGYLITPLTVGDEGYVVTKFYLDGVDLAPNSDAFMFGVTPYSAGQGYDTTFARSFQVAVATPGAHTLEVKAYALGSAINALARAYRSLKAVCLA